MSHIAFSVALINTEKTDSFTHDNTTDDKISPRGLKQNKH